MGTTIVVLVDEKQGIAILMVGEINLTFRFVSDKPTTLPAFGVPGNSLREGSVAHRRREK